MLRNYLTTAFRNFMKQPLYSIINVSGLVLGLACSILISLWIFDELSYDNYHPDNNRIYKVMQNQEYSDGNIETSHWTSGLLAETMKHEFPEIVETSRVTWGELTLFKYGTTSGYESSDYADPGIFEVLNLTLLEGDKAHALPDNNAVAISKKMARKYFKDKDAVGKIILMDNVTPLKVTAVFDDLPLNVTESFEYILRFDVYILKEGYTLSNYNGSGWLNTFVKLNDKNAYHDVNRKFNDLLLKHGEKLKSSTLPRAFLFPFVDWRLRANFVNGVQTGGRINYVIAFSAVGLFTLIIACINFMNLSTARSVNRSREVGIRKVAGASRNALIKQFLTESIVLSFAALILALLLVHVTLPLFNYFIGKQLSIDYADPKAIGGLLAITLFTGMVAGSYPAFFLSSFRPASVLKGNLQAVFSGANIRRGLVVFQFGLSVVIIICALGVNKQISYMRNMDLGFEQSHVMTIQINEEIGAHYEQFRNDLLQNPLIKSVAMGAAHPMEINGKGYYEWDGRPDTDDTYFNQAHGDFDYLTTLGFTFIQGRNFSRDFPADSNNFVITEEAANRMGFKDPIGRRLKIQEKTGEIIGVIRDFHNLDIHQTWEPTVFSLGQGRKDFGRWATIFVRYEPGKLHEAMEYTRSKYASLAPDFPPQLGFVDEVFENQFHSESVVVSLSSGFTVIAIVISCLGLLGLASFSAERRGKEISLRKVLGASVGGLVVLLCRDFTRLVLYSIIIGTPIAYYLIDEFVSQYPYHTDLDIWLFLAPAVVMLIIALIIVSYQSIRAATSNPVDRLRGE